MISCIVNSTGECVHQASGRRYATGRSRLPCRHPVQLADAEAAPSTLRPAAQRMWGGLEAVRRGRSVTAQVNIRKTADLLRRLTSLIAELRRLLALKGWLILSLAWEARLWLGNSVFEKLTRHLSTCIYHLCCVRCMVATEIGFIVIADML